MPIPIRSHSPIKSNSAATGPSSTPASLGNVPHSEATGAKEPTRLTREPAHARATSKVSARTVTERKPDNPGPATKVPVSNIPGDGYAARGRTRSYVSATSSGVTRAAPAVAGLADAAATSRSQQWTSSKDPANVRTPVLSSHSGALSATSKARRIAETRNSQNEARKASVVVPSHPLSSTAGKGSVSASEKGRQVPSVRPNFSTYQQRYSQKTPNAVPLASATAPNKVAIGPGSADGVLSAAEIENLRDELLQSSVVLERSPATLQAYEASIKSHLRASFEDAAKQLSLLKSRQCDRQLTVNAVAVSEWLKKMRQTSAVAHAGCDTLFLLAHCQGELQDVSEENGPFKDAMRIFDEWCVYSSSRRSNRAADDPRDGDDAQDAGSFLRSKPFVTEGWSASFSSVEGRVKPCAASLTDLQLPPESTSLGLLIKMQSTLVKQVLQEIAMCRSIEGLKLREEQAWLRTAVDAALQDAELHHFASATGRSVRRGIWDKYEVV
ncbi:hypothetical protein A1O7_09964 [Cladophialophora yegresii CBS 114405]|uniref:Uncharacterized protein n=1 Tax=Cladophialophora yegresii CBS 114405 TaxID=1182544 RepID=W9VGL2_9EURO|nr:uncharacterized protein A1O7_09964 [Cladophialophora yegresii CBS 114405]EXJ54623.1 hypothetical protein A1O7_09964 [Cladophialophora yegresii CBS 114405]